MHEGAPGDATLHVSVAKVRYNRMGVHNGMHAEDLNEWLNGINGNKDDRAEGIVTYGGSL